jgi:hypothetical protein
MRVVGLAKDFSRSWVIVDNKINGKIIERENLRKIHKLLSILKENFIIAKLS